MPNMFGGDQHHPAYDCKTKIKSNQVMVGNSLYTVTFNDGSVQVHVEEVDGTSGFVVQFPQQVSDKIIELKAKKG